MAAGTGFPYVLYELLKKESSSVVMWTSTGTAFGIRDMTSFRQDVLTCYFKHNKFSSFQRQLNLYGFRKVVKGRESGCYMHPSFLRDNPERLTEVKRGVVPPCPPHYSRRIYGSGPRFMNQDDGSDSEPELVVQPREHWDKGIGGSEVATHMRLGEMHISAAALAAARAQIKADGADAASSSHAAAAAAAAAARHLQVAHAHMNRGGVHHDGRGNPLNARDHVMGGGGRVPSLQMVSGGAVGFGPGPKDGSGSAGKMMVGDGGGGGRDGSRVRRQTSVSKMFGGGRQNSGSGGGMTSLQGSSAPYGVGSGMGSGGERTNQSQHMQQQQQQHHHQHQQHMSRYNSLPPPSAPQQSQGGRDGGGGGGGQMGGISSGYMDVSPLLSNAMCQEVGMGMGDGVGGGAGSARSIGGKVVDYDKSSVSTVMSLSRLLDGLGQTLDAPSEEELYTPIDKRNSFCAQMVNIAQVLEDDPSMQALEPYNSQFSFLAQKRRSSVSELAAYLHDMLEEGESNRMMPAAPGWLLPLPPAHGNNPSDLSPVAGAREGNGNSNCTSSRVNFKRAHGDDYNEAYGGYGFVAGGGNRNASEADGGDTAESALVGGFSKRVKGSPLLDPQSAPAAGRGTGVGREDGVGEDRQTGGRRMSAERTFGIGANPTVVQALTCLASGLNNSSSDSEGDGSGDMPPGDVGVDGELVTSSVSANAGARTGAADGANAPVVLEGSGNSNNDSNNNDTSGNGFDTLAAPASVTAEGDTGRRRGSNPIADVLTNFSIDRALEQFTAQGAGADDDADDGQDGGQQKLRQRASVYVLMHAIATVDTATSEEWEGANGEEILDGDEAATVAAAI